MEKARPMMEEMDGKVVFFPARVGIPDFDVLMYEVLFPICTLNWRVNNKFSRQERVETGEVKVQKVKFFKFGEC